MKPRPSDKPVDELPIDSIRVGKRYRQNMGDIPALAASILEHGLMHAVVVTPERDLVAGERRLEAVRLLGWTSVPVRVVTPADLLRAEADENAVRVDFSPSEAAAIATALRPIVEAEARERMSAGGKGAQIARPSRTADRLAAAVGMGARTLEKAVAVVAAADADPELGPVVAEMDASGNVDRAFRQMKRRTETQGVTDYIDLMPPAEQEWELGFRRQVRWSKRVGVASHALLSVTPSEFVPYLGADERTSTERTIELIEDWIKWTRKALAESGALRVIGGKS